MNELIKVESRKTSSGEILTVNARDIHTFLGIKRRFTDWIKDQIERGRFVEHRDFVVFHEKVKNPQKEENSKGRS